MRIALIQCPVWGVDDPPLALAQLAGCLLTANHEPQIFDLNIGLWSLLPEPSRKLWEPENFHLWDGRTEAAGVLEENADFFSRWAESIANGGARAAAFSVARGSQWASMEVARRLKELDPGITIIAGGPYCKSQKNMEEFLREPAIDIVVSGAGEDVIVKLAGLKDATGRWIPLPGTWIKSGGAVQAGGKPIPFSFDLDLSPMPSFSEMPSEAYAKPFQMPLTASRGCESKCFFCASREHWPKFSFKSGDRIYGEVSDALFKRPQWSHAEFYDLTANGRPDALRRFCEMLMERGVHGRKLTWRIQALPRPEMDAGLLGLMRDAGCIEIVYGVESGSPRVLEAMNKPLPLEMTETVLHNTREAGVKCAVSLIAGFPVEGKEEMDQTIRFLEKTRASIDRLLVTPFGAEEPGFVFRFRDRFPPAAFARARAESLRRAGLELGLEVSARDYSAGTAGREPILMEGANA